MSKRAKAKPQQRDVTSLFVEAAKELPEVQLILVEGSYPGDACIWTIIDAPPLERSFRDQVFQAELEALQQGGEPAVDFHLVNLQELDKSLQTVLPAGHRVLFRRKSAD